MACGRGPAAAQPGHPDRPPHTPVVGEPHRPEHPRGRATARRTTRGYG
nr:MAG TPA: hypothetical protein [Caudoviricetes sp.]